MIEISRRDYAQMYGPTVGDRVRLGDTSLLIEVEKDLTVYGDEAKFGGGKSLRDGMGQSCTHTDEECLDTVITNALIVDCTGIYKADVGIKDGKISGIGKAGNPQIMDGGTPGMIVGASTEAIAGEGLLLTAGGIDSHIHFISPTQVRTALYSGVTTMIGGGTGPADGTNATTCTPVAFHIARMLQSAEDLPINVAFLGKGNCSTAGPLAEQIEAGAAGLKLHEGDILARENGKVYAVRIAPSHLIETKVSSMQEMGRLCFELGNRHLSLKIEPDRVTVPYDEPTLLYLQYLGFDAHETHAAFADYIVCRAHGAGGTAHSHHHHHE